MDGDWWHLREGEDYTVSTANLRAVAYQQGRRHGYRVSTRLTEDGILLRFTPREDRPAENSSGFDDPR